MMPAPTSAEDSPPDSPGSRSTGVRFARALAASVGAWTAVVCLHASAGYSDQLRRGGEPVLAALLASYAIAYLPWVALSTLLYLVLDREGAHLNDPRRIARRFLQAVALFYVPQVAYQIALSLPADGPSYLAFAARWPAIFWLIDLALLVTTFTVVYAVVSVRQSLAARFREQRMQAENLTLRLDLEQQRLRGLRAQLEPHFLFNALNAISSLVRSEDRTLAVAALGQLSGLLRYALTASSTEWVLVADEVRFVREYLALQHLRYGKRLEVTIVGDDERVGSAECPPLLLQPLVENAIRHDLERHEGASDIRLSFVREGALLVIHVSNSTHPDAPPNPGLGLGLWATRNRIALAYRGRAEFSAGPRDGRFDVTLRLPMTADD